MDNTRKDKSEIIEFIINGFSLDSQQTAMIGDRKYDIVGAKNNSIVSIGVTYGHGNIMELKEENADYIINDCKELISLLSKINRCVK